MDGLDAAVFEPDPDRSFDDTDSSFQDLFSCHDYLALPCSLSDLEIFEIE